MNFDIEKAGVQVSFLIHISLLLYSTHLATSIVHINYFCDQDSKVMSWWDYGYQITAMANRTILVDNNTWNNTHISRVGQVEAALLCIYIFTCNQLFNYVKLQLNG